MAKKTDFTERKYDVDLDEIDRTSLPIPFNYKKLMDSFTYLGVSIRGNEYWESEKQFKARQEGRKHLAPAPSHAKKMKGQWSREGKLHPQTERGKIKARDQCDEVCANEGGDCYTRIVPLYDPQTKEKYYGCFVNVGARYTKKGELRESPKSESFGRGTEMGMRTYQKVGEQDIEALAVENVSCPYCDAAAGDRCVKKVYDEKMNVVAVKNLPLSQTHKQRLNKYEGQEEPSKRAQEGRGRYSGYYSSKERSYQEDLERRKRKTREEGDKRKKKKKEPKDYSKEWWW